MMPVLDVCDDPHFDWRNLPALRALFAALNSDGDEVRVVGGAVRNSLLGLPVGDIDCATTALPEQVIERGRAVGFKAIPTGLEHGTITLVREGMAFEVTSLRADLETDGRHAKVAFGRDWAQDASRRDFTMNALYLDVDGQLYDYLGSGVADAKARHVRFIGDARARIEEDYLRILRFFRFYAQYGHAYDMADYSACIALQAGLENLSAERVGAELIKLVQGAFAHAALIAMLEGGLLSGVGLKVPLVARFGFYQNQCQMLGFASSLSGALLALNGHGKESMVMLAQAWRLPNRLRDAGSKRAAFLEQISLAELQNADLSTLQIWAYHFGKDVVLDGLAVQHMERDTEYVRSICQSLQDWDVPIFPVQGKDLIAAGVTPGPEMGAKLSALKVRWIESGFALGKAALLDGLDPS